MTVRHAAGMLALAVAIAAGAAAWSWRTGAVGGSDSACYALMTKAYVEGRRQPESVLAREAPWPDATRAAAPGGFLPSADRPGAAVPVCAPGYSLLLAPLAAVAGLGAVHVVPPLAMAACVWLSFLLGRRLDGPWTGSAAACLVATHPILWFQAVQPMNDITTGALWLAVAVAALDGRAAVTGVLVGLGLLVRPNLAPAAVVAVLVCAAMQAAATGRHTARAVVVTVMRASLAAAPGVLAVLALNASLYGSPFRSGYGDLDRLFAASNVPVNVARYGATWLAISTPFVLAAVAAPFVLPRDRRRRAWGLVALAAALSIVYLAYQPFPEWWYLRFLLPAVALSLVLAASVITTSLRRVAGPPGAVAAVALALAWSAWMTQRPEAREARGLQQLEARFASTADAVATHLPHDAVALTGWDSGPIRFGTTREIVMWDALDPAWLDRAIAWLDAAGRPPAIVLEGWEEAGFRARFAEQVFGALDWPPRVDIDRRVRVYVPSDRARYLAGEAVHTETVVARRRRAGR